MPHVPQGHQRLQPDVPPLSSPRLLLRRPEAQDAEAIRALADDWEVARWMARLPHPYRLDDATFFLEAIVPVEPCWAIVDRFGGRFIGIIGLTPPAVPGAVEFGYWLGRPFWGCGFATEAGQLVLKHAFEAVELEAVRAGYFDGNSRSAHVLGKLGFHPTGTSQRISVARGATLAHVDFELTRESWRGATLA